MAKKKSKETEKQMSINDYLSLISISERDQWVVKRMFKNEPEKTVKDWDATLKKQCNNINYQKAK